jgi:putative endonuclease
MSNISKTLYVGVTNDLERRVWEHRQKLVKGFTERYNITMLVYFESCSWVDDAIAREKQLKGLKRDRKLALIRETNPHWLDLAADWFA